MTTTGIRDDREELPPENETKVVGARRQPDERPSRWEWLVWLLVAPAVVQLARIVWSAGRTIMNDDTALLWFAGREWGQLRVHQLNFYGQTYGSTLETTGIELLRRTVVRRQLSPSARRALRDAAAAVEIDDVRFLDRQQALVELTVRVDGGDARSLSGRSVLTEGTWTVKGTTFCSVIRPLGVECR